MSLPPESFWSKERRGTTIASMASNELANRSRALRARRERKQVRVVRAQRTVAATIAHEVKQPLSAVITNAEAGVRWLDRPNPNLDEAKAAFKEIIAIGYRAAAVIESIVAVFKTGTLNKTAIDVNDLVREALVRADLPQHGIQIIAETDAQLPAISGDRTQLQQVLQNLITNAIDSMVDKDEPRELCVRCQRHDDDNVLVSIADTGAGIVARDIDRIFNPLFTTKSRGMGMGLSICRSIIEAHNGRIWATPNKPRGAVFQFVLPGDSTLAEAVGQPAQLSQNLATGVAATYE